MKIQRKKLTKKYFLTIQPGMFLVGNSGSLAEPDFAEFVEQEPAKREAQWQRIVNSGAAQRTCNVCINKQQWLNFLKKFDVQQRFKGPYLQYANPSNSFTIKASHLDSLLPENFPETVERFKTLKSKGFDLEPMIRLCEEDADKLVASGGSAAVQGHNFLNACQRLRKEIGFPSRR